MSVKIELIGRYIILTDSVIPDVFEFPAIKTRYREEGGNITLLNTQNNNMHISYIWTDYTDADGNAWVSLAELIEWLRLHTGGVEPTNYFLEVSRGNIDGISHINKFGANTNILADTTEDVWDGGGTYTFPTTADITHMHQTTDQVAMRGGTIEIQGLDANWDALTQTKDLDLIDTSTPVILDTPLIRGFRLKVLENVVADSDIHVDNAANTIHYAIMTAGNNQTLMSIYTIPNGKSGYLTQYYATVIDATNKTPTSTVFKLWAADRENGYEFQLKHAVGIPSGGSMVEHDFKPYGMVGQKTDIKITAHPADEGANVASGFGLILVDN